MRRTDLATVVTAAGLVGLFWHQGERFVAANGPTFDEPAHLAAGLSYWQTGDFRMNAEDPPLLKLWWAVPLAVGGGPRVDPAADHWHAGDRLLFESGVAPAELLTPTRRMNLAVGCGIVLLAGWWAYQLWGRLAGLAATGFAAADPTLVSLSGVLTTDAGLAFFALLTTYLLWEYVGHPSRPLRLALGVSLGLLLATKFSAVAVVAGLAVAATWSLGPRAAVELAFRLGPTAAVTLAATYGFVGFGEWPKGLAFQLTRSAAGGHFYLNGELSRTGWDHYFLVAAAVKLPLGLLVAGGTGILACAAQAFLPVPPRAAWVVPLVLFALASYSRIDLGVRVVLPAVVFLYVLAGRLAAPGAYRLPRLVALAGCLGWAGAAGWPACPYPLSYFNELAGDPPPVADSNLDWGQGLPELKRYMDREGIESVHLGYFGTDRPEVHGIRYHPLPGFGQLGRAGGVTPPAIEAGRRVVVVSRTLLTGLYLDDPDTYRWLRERPPTAVVAGCLHVYDLTGDVETEHRLRSLR